MYCYLSFLKPGESSDTHLHPPLHCAMHLCFSVSSTTVTFRQADCVHTLLVPIGITPSCKYPSPSIETHPYLPIALTHFYVSRCGASLPQNCCLLRHSKADAIPLFRVCRTSRHKLRSDEEGVRGGMGWRHCKDNLPRFFQGCKRDAPVRQNAGHERSQGGALRFLVSSIMI